MSHINSKSTPAQRRKMLAGRGLERLSGAKLGTDEKKKSLRIAERNKAARHVREGLKKKEKRKKEKELEEVSSL